MRTRASLLSVGLVLAWLTSVPHAGASAGQGGAVRLVGASGAFGVLTASSAFRLVAEDTHITGGMGAGLYLRRIGAGDQPSAVLVKISEDLATGLGAGFDSPLPAGQYRYRVVGPRGQIGLRLAIERPAAASLRIRATGRSAVSVASASPTSTAVGPRYEAVHRVPLTLTARTVLVAAYRLTSSPGPYTAHGATACVTTPGRSCGRSTPLETQEVGAGTGSVARSSGTFYERGGLGSGAREAVFEYAGLDRPGRLDTVVISFEDC